MRIDEVSIASSIPYVYEEELRGRPLSATLIHPLLENKKVSPKRRISSRRSVRRMEKRQPSGRAREPGATETTGAERMRIDEESIISKVCAG